MSITIKVAILLTYSNSIYEKKAFEFASLMQKVFIVTDINVLRSAGRFGYRQYFVQRQQCNNHQVSVTVITLKLNIKEITSLLK